MKKLTPAACLVGLTLVVVWIPAHHAWGDTNLTDSAVAPLLRPEQAKDHAATSGLTQTLPPSLTLSHWTTEIVRLVQSGTDESILLSFVNNSGTFNLAADHIVYLGDLGVTDQVINAMLSHDREALARQRKITQNVTATTNRTTAAAGFGNAEMPRTNQFTHGNQPIFAGGTLIHSNRPPSAPKPKKTPYPVREPYPVEITAPIVFLDSPSF